jgi:hypothetical protein
LNDEFNLQRHFDMHSYLFDTIIVITEQSINRNKLV